MNEFIMPVYQVYVLTDERACITAVDSSAFLVNSDGWTMIDEGSQWPKYMHAQGNYFPDGIYTEDGIPKYKLVDGEAVERTNEEIEADRAAIPVPEPVEEVSWDVMAAAIKEGVNEV